MATKPFALTSRKKSLGVFLSSSVLVALTTPLSALETSRRSNKHGNRWLLVAPAFRWRSILREK